MTNLLTEDYRKSLRKDYHLRLITAVLIGLGGALIVGAIFLFPALLRSRFLARTLELEVEVLKAREQQFNDEQERAVISSMTKKINLLRAEQERESIYGILETLLKHRTSGIILESINYLRDNGKHKIELSGTATNRASLIRFINGLKEDKSFTGASVPIETLTSDKDIVFSLNLLKVK